MNDIMDWGECTRDFIKKTEIDPAKINSIVETAKSRLKFLKNSPIDKSTVSFIVEGYYEVIKELLVALLLSKGLRSKNHQCLISYFYKNYPDNEAEAYLISRMSYLRNRLNYYGEHIELGFYEKNKAAFEQTIDLLNKLINSEKRTKK